MIQVLFWGLVFGVWGVLFVVIQGPGEILGWFQRFYATVLPDYVTRPFWCPKCHAGWVALIVSYLWLDMPLEYIFATTVIAMFAAYFFTKTVMDA